MYKQKLKKLVVKPVFFVLTILSTVIFVFVGYMNLYLPDNYNVFEGKTLSVTGKIPISYNYCSEPAQVTESNNYSNKYNVNLKAFGFIPVKNANVSVIDKKMVYVSGLCFGIKIYTDGVLVIKTDTVDTQNGNVNPSADAGLKVGDNIISINGNKVLTNEEVADIIEKSNGSELKFVIKRSESIINLKITPEKSFSSGKYKAGIWVRDSSAGIGTLTFYSPAHDVICGLGHGVCDSDTGDILSMNSGELVAAQIISVTKGIDGCPGQLDGMFKNNSIGKLLLNSETGVYAKYNSSQKETDLTEIALKQEVKTGEAKILTTVDGETPKLYSCRIDKVAYNNKRTKNLVITVTDKELIEKTGGIVQGMSGSPILQNGKLIGAVTHVFVNNPLCGYGIFAENMLETAEAVGDKEKIKDAS